MFKTMYPNLTRWQTWQERQTLLLEKRAVLAQRTATAMTEIQSATNSINDAVAIIE